MTDTKWEYKTVTLNFSFHPSDEEGVKVVERLYNGFFNEAGKDGWEFAMITPNGFLVFKRPM